MLKEGRCGAKGGATVPLGHLGEVPKEGQLTKWEKGPTTKETTLLIVAGR